MKKIKLIIVLNILLVSAFSQNMGFLGYSNESNSFTISAEGGQKIVALFKDCKNIIYLEHDDFPFWEGMKIEAVGAKVIRDLYNFKRLYIYPNSPKVNIILSYNDSILANFDFGVRKVPLPEIFIVNNNAVIPHGFDILQKELSLCEVKLKPDVNFVYYMGEEKFEASLLIEFRNGNSTLFEKKILTGEKLNVENKLLKKVNNMSISIIEWTHVNPLEERNSLPVNSNEIRYFIVK